MTKFVLAAALTFGAALSARAQVPPGRRDSSPDTVQQALRDPDPIHRDERMTAIVRRTNSKMEADARRGRTAPTFKAGVAVTNRSAKTIQSVAWSATLTDPATGALIRNYDVTTRARIAPGRTKRLTEKLQTPHASVVNAGASPRSASPAVADLKVAIKRVTYVDGSTSETP